MLRSPPMPMAPAEWLAAYRTACLQRDADAAAALFTDDAPYAEHPSPGAFAGRTAVRSNRARLAATQSNDALRHGTRITGGTRTASEGSATLVNHGDPVA